MDVYEQMWPIAKVIYSSTSPNVGANILYFVLLILSIIVFRLGFAQKLPLLKNVLIYIFLAIGCTILTFLGAFLPIAEGLAITALILIIYKIRLHQRKRTEA
ncbi:YlaH-like family protein [Bacillus sinesaloumensis]|uniref:YlaH-like family protein n=1 Tax=Litchfieldia sinesaloumensis TaxID=1926280 RepID=UPI0009884D5F|nr:YlaH-like family protein [Bacillus sinesaloumensis]